MVGVEVELMQRQTIKPSSPTPSSLKTLKLSNFDQLAAITYTSLLLFFPINGHKSHHERSQHLKKSLSQTLTHFYPFAGRLKDNDSIECDDDGVEYIEARVRCRIADILIKNPDAQLLNQFLPIAIESIEAVTGSLLLVQASFFDCGGMAIGVCLSHKIADAATFSAFIKCWAETATGSSSDALHPVFMGDSIFPPLNFSVPLFPLELNQQKCATKRFVFNASEITALKAEAASASVPQPTRVEAVLGLLWKCITIASRSTLGFSRPSILALSANFRKKLAPPVPENYAGNCVWLLYAHAEEGELELPCLVAEIRKEIREVGDNHAKRFQDNGGHLELYGCAKKFRDLVMNKDVDFFNSTSWCRFGFYDADFGWGKPTWLTIASSPFKNAILLVDTRDGHGIEAWLTLSEQHMAMLESNHELLQFVAIN